MTEGRDDRDARQRAQALFVKAVRLVHMRRWRVAARALAECAALRGDDADLMLLRSRCYMELGRHLDALPLLEQAVDQLSTRDRRRHQLAAALADLGYCFRNSARGMGDAPRRLQREKALAAYRAASRMEPHDADLRDSVRQLESTLAGRSELRPGPLTAPGTGTGTGTGTRAGTEAGTGPAQGPASPDTPPSKAELS